MRLEVGDRGGSHLVGPHEIRLHYSLDLLQAVTGDCRNLRHRTICLGEAHHSCPAQILAIEMQCPRPARHRIPARREIALTHRFAAHAAQSFAIPAARASAIAVSRYGFRSLWHLIQTRAFVLLWMTRIRLPICTSTVVTPSRLRRNRVDPPAWMLPAHSIAPLARGPLANPRGIQNNRTEGQLSMNDVEEISDKERQPAVASRVVTGYGRRRFSTGGFSVAG